MNKTIKQLADELGVSKTAIRNYMTEDFRAKHTEKDDKGVITITAVGCKVISENLHKEAETTEKKFPESETLTIPVSVWQLMETQIREKDEQLKAKDQQIADLTATVKAQAQSINADRHNELIETAQHQLEAPKEKRGLLGWLKRKS